MCDHEPEIYPPEHKICEKNVDEPTILQEEDRIISVQWFGESSSGLLEDGQQFNFPLFVEKGAIEFVFLTEYFRVVFLGQACKWPAGPDTVERVIEGPGEGSPETVLLWALNPAIGMEGKEPGSTLPHSPCAKVVYLGDPNVGVISPREYCHLEVRDEVMASFERKEPDEDDQCIGG